LLDFYNTKLFYKRNWKNVANEMPFDGNQWFSGKKMQLQVNIFVNKIAMTLTTRATIANNYDKQNML